MRENSYERQMKPQAKQNDARQCDTYTHVYHQCARIYECHILPLCHSHTHIYACVINGELQSSNIILMRVITINNNTENNHIILLHITTLQH